MSTMNNAAPTRRARNKRGRDGAAPPEGRSQPPQKKRKTQAKRQRKRNARNGRAMSRRGGPGSIAVNDPSTRLERSMVTLQDVIERDEFVADVLGSGGTGTTVVTKFPFNPGQASLFPIGAAEAKNWTYWRCVKAEPYLLHEVSEFATDGSTGKMGLSFDYNAANSTPTTKQQLEDMHSCSCMPSEDISLPLLVNHINKADPKYVRVGAQPSGTDIRLFDGGSLFTWVSGQAGTSKVAELRIRYFFEVYVPTLLNAIGGATSQTSSFFTSSAAETSGATTVATNLLAATAVSNGLAVVNTSGSFVPPAGNYLVDVNLTETNTGSTTKNELNVLKNAATIYAGATLHPTIVQVAGDVSTVFLSASVLVSANGTDAFTFPYTQTGGTGNAGTWGSVRFTAVL